MLDATAGEDIGAPYYAPLRKRPFLQEVSTDPGKLRIAFTGTPMLGKQVDADTLQALKSTVQSLQALGHDVVEAAPTIDGELFSLAFVTIVAGELRADIEDTARAAGKKVSVRDFDPSSFGMGMLGKALSAQEYATAARYLQVSARKVAAFFEDYDVLLTPTLSKLPFKIGSLQPSAGEKAMIRMIGSIDGGRILKAFGLVKSLAASIFEFTPWTPIFNVTGQPAMSVPLEWTGDRLPIGMHFVAKFGDEATLFRLAGQLEKAKPWADMIPVGY
jgi:amidase